MNSSLFLFFSTNRLEVDFGDCLIKSGTTRVAIYLITKLMLCNIIIFSCFGVYCFALLLFGHGSVN